MTKILFQGDSITDCGRSREDDSNKGRGYATLVMSELGFDAPGKYEFVNRAVSANKITDLYARIKADIINLKPDVMSIL
ncbi:MAG: lysophospholipase, partial [Clostridia bacterium]|nr:lysophospholipase [Clostridia bacterium]